METKKLLQLVVRAAEDKKAQGVAVFRVAELTTISDYFVICSGQSTIQVKAIADGIIEAIEEAGLAPLHVEGYQFGHWVLLDCGDVVVHVFLAEERDYYGIERLWRDAPQVKEQLPQTQPADMA